MIPSKYLRAMSDSRKQTGGKHEDKQATNDEARSVHSLYLMV